MHPVHQRQLSIEEYVRIEAESPVKHEFFDGQVVAMGGGTLEHARLAGRLLASLARQLEGRPCNVYTSDARVRVTATGLVTYPDLTVACGSVQIDREDPLALINPVVIVEVASPSSDLYDRGDKLEHYKQIASLREVIIVAHEAVRLETWSRGDDGPWSGRVLGAGEQADLASIGCRLDVDEIYRDPMA